MVRLNEYKGSFGAAIGDIVGSVYEFDSGPKLEKDAVVLFSKESEFTDDTVMTVAVSEYLFHNPKNLPMKDFLLSWGHAYPNAGYGGSFLGYLFFEDDPKPYNSFGNGAAMRISAVAYKAKSEEEVKKLSYEVTSPTHNHPEGLKGAEVTAMAIYKALHGESKEKIEAYARQYYDLDLDYQEMHAERSHGPEICQVTVPQALWCFFHSESFEDCLRLAITIRWDADTLADIACSIAEAYYKEIPENILLEAKKRLPKDILEALERIEKDF